MEATREKQEEPDDSSIDDGPKWAAIAFVTVLIGIGLPVWWKTTTVHRAYLPYEEIDNLPLSSPNQLIQIYYKGVPSEGLQQRIASLQSAINQSSLFDFEIIHLKFSESDVDMLNSVNTIHEIEDLVLETASDSVEGLIFMEISKRFFPLGKQLILGRHQQIYVSSETAIEKIAHTVHHVLYPKESFVSEQKMENTVKLIPSLAYNILLTLATSNPAVDWSLRNIGEGFLTSFADAFTKVANISVTSQVVYVGDGYIDAPFHNETKSFHLNEDRVATLINALEPKLGSQLSVEPTFHWVVYVPHAKQIPMQIYLQGQPVLGNSVLSPRWNGGGLQIIDGEFDEQNCAQLLMAQLRKALGLNEKSLDDDVLLLDYDSSGLHTWELDSLIRSRTVKFLHSAATTLKSLCKLLSQIGNIVISDSVASDIIISSVKSTESREALTSGRINQAYADAQAAVTRAEKAFFHPSLLALLYFPDDQKYAIYIPLFLPVGIPVVLSLRSIGQWLFSRSST